MSNQRDGGRKEHPSRRSGHRDGEHQRQYGHHNWTARKLDIGLNKAVLPVEVPYYNLPKEEN